MQRRAKVETAPNSNPIYFTTGTAMSNDFEKFLQEVREFVLAELLPLEPQLLAEGFGSVVPALQEKRKLVKDLGWWLPQMSKDVGGMGLSVWEFGRMSEILAWTPSGHYAFNAQAPDAGNMEILHQYGSAEQKAKWLQPLGRRPNS